MSPDDPTSPRWPSLKEALKRRLSAQAYAAWVSQMSCLADNGNTLRIGLPDAFSLNWVNDHYRHVLEEELRALAPSALALELTLHSAEVAATTSSGAAPSDRENPAHDPLPSAAVAPGAPAPAATAAPVTALEVPEGGPNDPHAAIRARLNPRYNFPTFVVGPSNELAWTAARSVAENRAPTFCPLVIVGGVGLGKTHLLHAIAHALLKRRPLVRVQIKTSEDFTNDVVQGIRNGKMDEVRRAYRACDVLIIDDIQFISGKAACQEEFFHTFNSLYDAQKQIVVSSDRLPHEIADIEERVRTRFAWGLIADLKVPELETRIAILKKKAEAEKIALDDSVATFLAQSVRSNVRELEGSLIRVHAFASLTQQPITVALAREVLKGIISEKGRALNPELIIKLVSQHFDVKVADLKSTKRARNIALPRQIAMYLCRRHTAASYPEIGQALGGKDHTTALNAFKRISERISDPEIRSHVEDIERALLE
jgi:chromosomal replication initiator protein